jgi:hypothetical protein
MKEKTFSMNKWILVALVVLCWAILVSFLAVYYSYEYSDLLAKVKTRIITANLGIDYGNGSATRWFNGTRISAGSTLFDLTKLVASVNYTSYPTGVWMNAIDGVFNSKTKYWGWYSYSSFGWSLGPVACDRYVVGDNETLKWSFS